MVGRLYGGYLDKLPWMIIMIFKRVGVLNCLWMRPLWVDGMENVVDVGDDQNPWVVLMMKVPQLR